MDETQYVDKGWKGVKTVPVWFFSVNFYWSIVVFPRGGHGNPLQYSCLENPHGQKSLLGYSPWGHAWAAKHIAVLLCCVVSTAEQSESVVCVHVCVPLFFGFPARLGHHRALNRSPVLYSSFWLVMYFIHYSVYLNPSLLTHPTPHFQPFPL